MQNLADYREFKWYWSDIGGVEEWCQINWRSYSTGVEAKTFFMGTSQIHPMLRSLRWSAVYKNDLVVIKKWHGTRYHSGKWSREMPRDRYSKDYNPRIIFKWTGDIPWDFDVHKKIVIKLT